MAKTKLDDAKEIADRFVQTFMGVPPYEEYVNKVGVSDLRTMQRIRQSGKARRKKHQLTGKSIEPQDDLGQWCLTVGLSKPLAAGVCPLPEEFEGLRVYVEVIGEISPA